MKSTVTLVRQDLHGLLGVCLHGMRARYVRAVGAVCLSGVLWSSAQAMPMVIHVSSSDNATQQPVQTSSGNAPAAALNLRHALGILASDKARLVDAASIDTLQIELAPGVYRLAEPLKISEHPSWKGTSIVISGPSKADATIDGGRIVQGFLAVEDSATLARLAPQARGHVVVASLDDSGITDFGSFHRHGFGLPQTPAPLELFFRGEPMTLARWPESGFASITSVTDGESGRRFTVAGADLAAWQDEPDIQAMGYWARDWADTTLHVEAIDPVSGQITLESPSPQFGIKAGQRVFFENLLSELSRPGEWYLDRATGRLYFWPPAPLRDGDVEVSMADGLISITSVSDLRISGLNFVNSRGSALDMRGVQRVSVEHSTIRNVGGRAAIIAGRDSGLSDVHIENTGEGGVALYGGDRATLQPGNLFVRNCVIRNYARRSHAYKPAISIDGVGNQAVGNHISEGPHAAIIFDGNDHLIAHNEIDHVATETDDTGAIYTGRDWTARGTVIEDNFLHDIGSAAKPQATMGVYLDDQASGITIRGNVFSRVNQAVFIGGGRDNLVENNLFANCSPAMYIDSRGLSWQKGLATSPNGVLRSQLAMLHVDQPPYLTRYPTLASLLSDAPGAPKGVVVASNVVIGGKPLSIDAGAQRYVQVDGLFGESDVVFAKPMPDAARVSLKDFQLSLASSALARGFKAPAAVLDTK